MSVAYFAKKVGTRYEVKVVNGFKMPDHEDSARVFHMIASDVEGPEFLEILKQKVMASMHMPEAAIQLWMCDTAEMQNF